jgi:prephenate dehydratase
MTEARGTVPDTVLPGSDDSVGTVTIGYQGEPGAYSEEAASVLFPGSATRGFRTFRLVVEALTGGAVDAAVLPVENTLGGVIQEVNDLLWETPGLRVTGEHVHLIVHCLIGRRGRDVTRAMSHPQALSQCRHWLHSRGIEAVVGDDTAGSARWLAEHPSEGLAAIASAAAARRYGLEVLAEGIQDDDSNRTRFLVVDRGVPARPRDAAAGTRCSLAFVAAHRPGSLVAALHCLSDRAVNLTRLDSRPLVGRPFEYRFYLDFEVAEPDVAEATLHELETKAAEVRLFGTYRRAD